MKTIYDIFRKSPFSSLNEHIKKVESCVNNTEPLIDSFINGNFEKIEFICKDISNLEKEADLIKNELRENLPKSVFMPVSREDFLKLLHRQDDIADYCEELAIILSVRKTQLLSSLKENFIDYYHQAKNTATLQIKISKSLHDLMETSFSGPKAEEIMEMINQVGQLERETDEKKNNLLKALFAIESETDPVSVVLLLKIIDLISGLAESSESASNALRLMVSK